MGDEKLIGDWIDPFRGETGAYMLWCLANSDMTAFLRLSRKWSTAAVDRLWVDIGKRPGHEDGPAQIDVLCEELGGVLPHDYDWMLHSAVLKDAVTAYEVYLEDVGGEVLGHYGYRWKVKSGMSPHWSAVVSFYDECLDIKPATDSVHAIRDLRHVLTHRRGELRTEEQRKRFGSRSVGFPTIDVELTFDEIVGHLAKLKEAVCGVERAVVPFLTGAATPDGLDERRYVISRSHRGW